MSDVPEPTRRPEWAALEQHRAQGLPGLRDLFDTDPSRAERYVVHVGDLRIDYSKHLPAAAITVPFRPRVSITPSASSARYALATVFAARPRVSASPRTVGSRYPTGSSPDRACSAICARTCS